MKDKKKPLFYTLLHIRSTDANKVLAENTNSNLSIYIKCCEALHNSLKNYGYNLIVLTNEKEVIEQKSKTLKVQNIDFKLNIPSDIKFYSAHYKIDVFKYLSEKEGYSILIDCDVVCINNLPLNMKKIISTNTPMCYDITNQRYPAYGREKLIKDKFTIMKKESIGNWFGGEFISGDSSFFDAIYSLCMKYWDNYRLNYQQIQHQGDEMLTSCAIEEYQRQNNFIFDVGTIGGIERYWSCNTLHYQKSFKSLNQSFLLHLPADKKIIAKHAKFITNKFILDYSKYLKVKKAKNNIISFVHKIKKA